MTSSRRARLLYRIQSGLQLRSRLIRLLEAVLTRRRPSAAVLTERRRSIASGTLRLGVVLVGWDAGRTSTCAQLLRRDLDALGVRSRFVLVTNRDLPELGPVPVDLVVRGDNAEAEFSGYDQGVAAVLDEGPVDVWLLTNDRLVSYDDAYRDLLDPAVLADAVAAPLLIGQVDRLPLDPPVVVFGTELSAYVRSNYLMLSEQLRSRLAQITTVTGERLDELLPAQFSVPLQDLPSPELAPSYLAYLADWLTASGGGRNGTWYRSAPFEPAAWAALRLKVHSILNEHLLSGRARALGAILVGPRQAALLARLPDAHPLRARSLSRLGQAPDLAWSFREQRVGRLELDVAALRVEIGHLLRGVSR